MCVYNPEHIHILCIFIQCTCTSTFNCGSDALDEKEDIFLCVSLQLLEGEAGGGQLNVRVRVLICGRGGGGN